MWLVCQQGRKVIVKSFKKFVEKIATDEYGYRVLIKAFQCVDDTDLIKKVILAELIEALPKLILDKNGHFVVLHVLQPSLAYLAPIIRQQLETITCTEEGNPCVSYVVVVLVGG